jgi:hypothetical protein
MDNDDWRYEYFPTRFPTIGENFIDLLPIDIRNNIYDEDEDEYKNYTEFEKHVLKTIKHVSEMENIARNPLISIDALIKICKKISANENIYICKNPNFTVNDFEKYYIDLKEYACVPYEINVFSYKKCRFHKNIFYYENTRLDIYSILYNKYFTYEMFMDYNIRYETMPLEKFKSIKKSQSFNAYD